MMIEFVLVSGTVVTVVLPGYSVVYDKCETSEGAMFLLGLLVDGFNTSLTMVGGTMVVSDFE